MDLPRNKYGLLSFFIFLNAVTFFFAFDFWKSSGVVINGNFFLNSFLALTHLTVVAMYLLERRYIKAMRIPIRVCVHALFCFGCFISVLYGWVFWQKFHAENFHQQQGLHSKNAIPASNAGLMGTSPIQLSNSSASINLVNAAAPHSTTAAVDSPKNPQDTSPVTLLIGIVSIFFGIVSSILYRIANDAKEEFGKIQGALDLQKEAKYAQVESKLMLALIAIEALMQEWEQERDDYNNATGDHKFHSEKACAWQIRKIIRMTSTLHRDSFISANVVPGLSSVIKIVQNLLKQDCNDKRFREVLAVEIFAFFDSMIEVLIARNNAYPDAVPRQILEHLDEARILFKNPPASAKRRGG